MKFLLDKRFIIFAARFFLIFILLYYTTIAQIGMAAPGGHYNIFVDKYLDYVSGIKNSLMYCTKGILLFFGIKTRIEPGYLIRIINGRGVKIAMDCVGYGVYSFWIAYVAAHDLTLKKKMQWIIFGLLSLFLINDIRITLFLVAINRGWPMPLGIDHHSWFSFFAYLLILIMMYFFTKAKNPASPNLVA